MSTKNIGSKLAQASLKEIPTSKSNAKDIVALVKKSGKITGYKLSDGEIVDTSTAITLARNGGINAVGISENQGTEYLKSIPDGEESNNLSHLPTISQ